MPDTDPIPSPSPLTHTSFLKDISNNNFKTPTPKLPSSRTFSKTTPFSTTTTTTIYTTPNPKLKTPGQQHFFTASKNTPKTSTSHSLSSSRHHRRHPTVTLTSRKQQQQSKHRLRHFELEQSQSSRKEQIKKEKSIKSLSKSLSSWLNFLFENPGSCMCEGYGDGTGERVGLGKRRESGGGGKEGRVAKRVKEVEEERERGRGGERVMKKDGYYLRESLKEVCSVEDLKERMMRGIGSFVNFSLDGCGDVLNAITLVAKNIDEGRLKMKAHCPIITDVGMREKAIKVLLSYNPFWLRIGLYVILGGESLLPNEDCNSEQEIAFLKMVIEKQFFSHAGLAKAYAYNKLVDGVYRPGYFEALGNVLLKRFLLLVLILDRGKSQSSLPLKHGIDGLDGGSPLLFNAQSKIKSSRQMINDFLSSDVMHGEGNLLAHLVIIGYKVSYQQIPLIEYNFRITDLFEDMGDGVRLCRAIQLLQHDASILQKVILPSDTPKKKLANCGVALQYFKQAGVPLQDDDGLEIIAEDIARGDKELTLSLLWNVFVHLQLPLLIPKNSLSEEISKVRKANSEMMDFVSSSTSHLDMLLNWMKAICENYDIEIGSPSSLVDGKAMWCLLDFYFRKELHCPSSLKDFSKANEESIVSRRDSEDAVHNFVLSQKLTTLLGNFPEVLQICDILENNGACNDRSVVILLVFLSSQLLVKKSKDQLNFHKLMGCCQTPERKRWSMSSEATVKRESEQSAGEAANKFKEVKAWWQEMTKSNVTCNTKLEALFIPSFSGNKCSSEVCLENAAVVIQSHFRQVMERKKYLKIKRAISCLKLYMYAWVVVRQSRKFNKISNIVPKEMCERLDGLSSQVTFMVDRHNFVRLRNAACLIQKIARIWICQRRLNRAEKVEDKLKVEAAVKIQLAWKQFLLSTFRQNQNSAATVIQSHFRSQIQQSTFQKQKKAAVVIQSIFRSLRSLKDFHESRVIRRSTIIIQSHLRGWLARRKAHQHRHCIVYIQSNCRRWLARKDFVRQREAALRIQNALRVMMCCKTFHSSRFAATEIQRIVRGRITRARLLGASHMKASTSTLRATSSGIRLSSPELRIVIHSIVTLQRWWRRVKFKVRQEAATLIQAYIRGRLCRHIAAKERDSSVFIQAHWRGYRTRKDAKGQLLDLRSRIQKSAATVHDGLRIINRLVAALKELKSMKNVSGILHNCAILDLATTHSQKCCERLVEEGAVGILLYQIRSVTRSIPDQQVLKHCLSTLRNLACYPHLADAVINEKESVETIFLELLRNKEEGFFIACELIKKLCTRPRVTEALRNSPSMLKRLHALVEELSRKVNHEKRKPRAATIRETTERRFREARELEDMITHA